MRELKRQRATLLFHRFALSKNAEGILKLAKQGQQLETESDIIKSPYVRNSIVGSFVMYAKAQKNAPTISQQ
jgi:predicted nuclease of restriction endonuclease-like (RecB) superfamily